LRRRPLIVFDALLLKQIHRRLRPASTRLSRPDYIAPSARRSDGKDVAMSVVSIEERGPVSIIAINRPEKLNAINKAVATELQEAFAAFDRSGQRVAILTGRGGRAFSAGAEVTDPPELGRGGPAARRGADTPVN